MERNDERSSNKILGRLLGPDGPELTCEECFDKLDRYVELEVAARTPTRRSGMRAHLEGCPACHEDYESLKAPKPTESVARLKPAGSAPPAGKQPVWPVRTS